MSDPSTRDEVFEIIHKEREELDWFADDPGGR